MKLSTKLVLIEYALWIIVIALIAKYGNPWIYLAVALLLVASAVGQKARNQKWLEEGYEDEIELRAREDDADPRHGDMRRRQS